MAISLRRIDPVDIPDSAKIKETMPSSMTTSERATQKKRKADQEGDVAVNTASRTLTLPSATQLAEDETVEEIHDEEIADELYCRLNTNVVGIQYYKGQWIVCVFLLPLIVM